MQKYKYEKYMEILDLFEDYISGGYKSLRKSPPGVTHKVINKKGLLEELIGEIKKCRKCNLSENRINTVPGAGALNPAVFIIGEAPGADEDKKGEPFVGKAGQYLDTWLKAINLSRSTNCYIGNILKCRPPGNRDPLPEESNACIPFLERQIELLKPLVILTPGRISSQIITGSQTGIGRIRGKIYRYKGIPVVPTYHPAAVLRNPSLRRDVWEDLKKLKAIIDNG